MDTSFIHTTAPIWVFLISFIIIFWALVKVGIPGGKWISSVLSLILSLIFISNKQVTEFSFHLVPWFASLAIIFFLFLTVLAFVKGEFNKGLAIAGLVIGIVIVIFIALSSFPTLYHMLPGTSDSHLNSQLVDIKDYIYDTQFKQNFLFVIASIVVGILLVKGK